MNQASGQRAASWIHDRLNDLPDLFWITGLGLAQVLFINECVERDERGEWLQYLALALVLPVAMLVIALLPRFLPSTQCRFGALRFLAGMAGVGMSFYLLWHAIDRLVLGAACLQTLTLFLIAWRRQGRKETLGNPSWWWTTGLTLLILIPAWAAASRLVWWTPFLWWIANLPLASIAFFVFVLLTSVAFSDSTPTAPKTPWRLWTIPNVLAMIVLAAFSLRGSGFFGSMIHPAVIIGPAELVRQGGWLLWDVPAQYGFLNTLLLAILPCATIWQSLYIVNAVLLFLASLLLFLFFRLSGRGLLHYCCALLVSLSAVHWMCGWIREFQGPQTVPSSGPYRFFWIYSIAAVLLWELHLAYSDDRRWTPVWIGLATWLASCLWSAESAVYCSVMLMPAYVGMLFRRLSSQADSRPLFQRLRTGAACLLAPLGLVALTVLFLFAFYRMRLGCGPDWRCYFDYCVAFKNGFGSFLIEPKGGVALLLSVFFGMGAVVACILRGSNSLGMFAVFAGVWGGCWAAASYFVPRSHENNVANLTPIFCVGIAVALDVISKENLSSHARLLLRVVFVPCLATIMVIPFGCSDFPSRVSQIVREGYYAHIEAGIPVEPNVASIREAVEVAPDEAFVSVREGDFIPDFPPPPPSASSSCGTRWVLPKAWIPLCPTGLFDPLPAKRSAVYLDRFVARHPGGGWVLLSRVPSSDHTWVLQELIATHHPTKTVMGREWMMIYFDCK